MPGNTMSDVSFKAFNGQINIDQAEGIVECFVAAIGNKDSVGDVVLAGAFNESLKRRKPRVVWGHSWNDPIGKVLEIYEVPPSDPRLPAKMKQAGVGGLFAKVQFNLATEKGREAFSSVAFFGHEQEWSIGYKTLQATFDPNIQANLLKEVELYEVSPVLHGANQLTATLSVKSDEGEKCHSPMGAPGFGPQNEPKLVVVRLDDLAGNDSDEQNRDLFAEGEATDISGERRNALEMELMSRSDDPIRVIRATENSAVFVRMDDGKATAYRISYHFEPEIQEFMFGKPERLSGAAESRVNPPTVVPSQMPAMPMAVKPGMSIPMQPTQMVMQKFDREKSLEVIAETISSADSGTDKVQTIIDLLQQLVSTGEKSDEETTGPEIFSIELKTENIFEAKQLLDPVLDYHRLEFEIEDEAIRIVSPLSDDSRIALENARTSIYQYFGEEPPGKAQGASEKSGAPEFQEVKALGGKLGSRIGGGLRSAGPGLSFVDVTGTVDADVDGIVFEGKPGLERPIIPRFVVPKELARKLSKLTVGDAESIEKQRKAGRTNIQFDENQLRSLISDLGEDPSVLTRVGETRGMRSSSDDSDMDVDYELDEIADRQFREERIRRRSNQPARPPKSIAELRKERGMRSNSFNDLWAVPQRRIDAMDSALRKAWNLGYRRDELEKMLDRSGWQNENTRKLLDQNIEDYNKAIADLIAAAGDDKTLDIYRELLKERKRMDQGKPGGFHDEVIAIVERDVQRERYRSQKPDGMRSTSGATASKFSVEKDGELGGITQELASLNDAVQQNFADYMQQRGYKNLAEFLSAEGWKIRDRDGRAVFENPRLYGDFESKPGIKTSSPRDVISYLAESPSRRDRREPSLLRINDDAGRSSGRTGMRSRNMAERRAVDEFLREPQPEGSSSERLRINFDEPDDERGNVREWYGSNDSVLQIEDNNDGSFLARISKGDGDDPSAIIAEESFASEAEARRFLNRQHSSIQRTGGRNQSSDTAGMRSRSVIAEANRDQDVAGSELTALQEGAIDKYLDRLASFMSDSAMEQYLRNGIVPNGAEDDVKRAEEYFSKLLNDRDAQIQSGMRSSSSSKKRKMRQKWTEEERRAFAEQRLRSKKIPKKRKDGPTPKEWGFRSSAPRFMTNRGFNSDIPSVTAYTSARRAGTRRPGAGMRSRTGGDRPGRTEITGEATFFKSVLDSLPKEISEARKAGDDQTASALGELSQIMRRQKSGEVGPKRTNAGSVFLTQAEVDQIIDALMFVLDRQSASGGSRAPIFAQLIEMVAKAGMSTFIDKKTPEISDRFVMRPNSEGRMVKIPISR